MLDLVKWKDVLMWIEWCKLPSPKLECNQSIMSLIESNQEKNGLNFDLPLFYTFYLECFINAIAMLHQCSSVNPPLLYIEVFQQSCIFFLILIFSHTYAKFEFRIPWNTRCLVVWGKPMPKAYEFSWNYTVNPLIHTA